MFIIKAIGLLPTRLFIYLFNSMDDTGVVLYYSLNSVGSVLTVLLA